MASPDKLTFYFPNRTPPNTRIEWKLDRIQDQSVIWAFTETELVYFDYKSSNFSLEIECYACKTITKDGFWKDKKTPSESKASFLSLKSAEKIVISETSSPGLGYCPGDYEIRLTKKDTREVVKTCFFKVGQNSQFSDRSFEILLDMLEKTVSGLTFSRERRYGKLEKAKDGTTLEDFLETELSSVLSAYRKITADMNPPLVNAYVRERIGKKQNAKSIRMNLMHPSADKCCNVRKETEVSNAKNRTLCHYVMMTRMLLDRMFAKSEMTDAGKKISDVYTRLGNDLSAEGVRPSDLVPLSFLEDGSYVFFKDFYDRLKTIDKVETDRMLSRKRTTLLFELFGLALLDKALIANGYSQTEASAVKAIDFGYESKVAYESGTRKAVIVYNHTAGTYHDLGNKESFVSINSMHNKPDFICEIFDKETGQLADAVILEMKYRSEKNLDQDRDRLIDTMNDYSQLAYMDKEGKVERGKIGKLFVVYPSLTDHIERNYAFNTDRLGIDIENLET